MDARKLREGPLWRYKSSLLSSKWKNCYGVLFADSTLCLYNQKSDRRPVESIFLKNVIPYICVGLMTDRMPVRRPSLPVGVAVQRLVGIGMDPRAEKVHWLLFPSEVELEAWFNEIVKTLPPPPVQPPTAPSGQPSQPRLNGPPTQPSSAYVPPPRYPDAPPVINYGYSQGGSSSSLYHNHNPGYGQNPPPQPSNTTVIIDRGGGHCGSSSFGSGIGFGTGMLTGSLLGYGIGSFFTPHCHSFGGFGGGFGGFPSSHGFGGGYVQDNDTYITNNYYNSSDEHNTSHMVTNHEPTSQDGNDQQHNDDNTSRDDSGGHYDGEGDYDVGFDGGDDG